MVEAAQFHQCVLVCQNRTCKKQGAALVLQAFQTLNLTDWMIIPSPCLGQCGNGPMVRVLPGDVWYWQVRPDEVSAIAQRHLLGGHPVAAMLYPAVHS